MAQLDSQEDIRQFLLANGLLEEQMDEQSEPSEIRGPECKCWVKDCLRDIEHRLASIEYRLNRLEREGHEHHKD